MTKNERIERIIDAFFAIGNADLYLGNDELMEEIVELSKAAEAGEWKLIAEVAAIIAKPEKYAAYFARRLAATIHERPHEFGLEDRQPSKADILDIMKLRFEPLFDLLPTSKKGLTNWWKQVDCKAKQSRGYSSKSMQKLMKDAENLR